MTSSGRGGRLAGDWVAGVSVAAVALPIGLAYAPLAGLPPVFGIYSCILPAVAYALVGSSRQLIVNPDAATCAIVASTLAPLATGGAARYADLSLALTFLVGVLCMAGGLARLGAIANFLSRPILTGYLNGIALSIIAGQLGTLLGFPVPRTGFFRTLAYVSSHLGQTHMLTLAVGASLFVLLRVLKFMAPRVPGPLVAAVLAIAAVSVLGLAEKGVAIVGTVPAGFPLPRLPGVGANELVALLPGACGIALVSFCSMMTTARGFAAKNGYTIDPNRDLIALGASDLASGVSGGFVVSGADSRTAVADASGGRTRATAIVAAFTMAVVLLFLTRPLSSLPEAALAAILFSSALGLFDFASLRAYWRLSRAEFSESIVAMVGVMTVGVLPGIVVAVGLALVRLIRAASHPRDALLGLVHGKESEFAMQEGGEPVPGLMIYRFEGPILFFNADYFKERVLALRGGIQPTPRWLLLDAESIGYLDVTGAERLDALRSELSAAGVVLAIARAKGLFLATLERCGGAERVGKARFFPSIHAGVQAFFAEKDAG